MNKATKHNYVSPPVTKMKAVQVGLRRAWFSAVGLFLGWKSKISHEQNVCIFQFYIRLPSFRLSGSIIMKKLARAGLTTRATSKLELVTVRTGLPLSQPSQSHIRDHAIFCNSNQISLDHFSIIGTNNKICELRILEEFLVISKASKMKICD